MKIGIDCRMYGSKQAGLGRYVEQLVLGLAEVHEENEYVLFTAHEFEITNNTNLRKVFVDIPWYSLQEQVKFKKIIDKEKVDLMHFPHWNVPLLYNKPFVVTVHDLIMYHYPRQEASTHGPIVYWFKDLMHRLVLRQAVKRAKKIIVTSEFTKQDLNKTLGVPIEKMVVTYQAPSQLQNADCRMQNGDLEKFGINKKFVLYVGNAYPHKNLEGLLKAWKIFEEKYGSDYQLVLVGKKNFFYEKLLNVLNVQGVKNVVDDGKTGQSQQLEHFEHIQQVKRFNNVVFTDYLSDSELAEIYQQASLYVFPSLYEGFGLPPLEAQTYGVPVVSSSSSCLPEILGDSALYFDPENFEQMAEVIYRGITDENIRFELRQNTIENLKRFNLNKMVNQTLEAYNRVV